MKSTANYSIKDLEDLSGIKAHTLRIWEKRYSLFEPDRTDTNIRYYSNDDLKRILNISLLNKNGIKISHIAQMREAEITEKVSALSLVRTDHEDLIDNLIIGMIELDEMNSEKIFSACILRMGFESTIQKIIFPFFQRIGVMWQTGGINPAQEHFVSNIVRQKLIVAIDGVVHHDDKNVLSALLFLPENELHEISLLFYNYALKARKLKTIYLGQTVPTDSLLRIVDISKPDFLITVVTNPLSKNGLEKYVGSFTHNSFRKTKVFISGKAAIEYKKKLPSNVFLFKSLDDLISLISK